MILVKYLIDLDNLMKSYRSRNLSIGFVPTMGALHPGHISLIRECNKHCPVTVCSIFVNPTQFNNTNDFIKYPITLEKDIDMLEAAGCDVLFLPSTLEMYPVNDPVIVYELGYIETLLEGKYRPGHFQGVCRIVDKLLSAVLPNSLFLGQKDYQQCMVIKKMMDLKHNPIHLQVCETLREEDGLAMSSRNLRLNAEERKKALNLFQSMRKIKAAIKTGDNQQIRQEAFEKLTRLGFKVDYIEIADASDLLPISVWDGKQKAVVLVAATLNDVRLIDNLLLN